ncbi:hypothetical protein ACH4GK_33200 [Streptomyces rimosus]|uniref:hypothetical protein n=1 Tax=Streptomyces rimosus TaxID=1927 RepID=UPI0004C6FC71|nr:hypothetical protein [Streptomyces rimosus]
MSSRLVIPRLAIAAAVATASLLTAVPAQADGMPTYTCDQAQQRGTNEDPKKAVGQVNCVASNGAPVPEKPGPYVPTEVGINSDFKIVGRDGHTFRCTLKQGMNTWGTAFWDHDSGIWVVGWQCDPD